MNELKRNAEGYSDPTAHKALMNVQKGERVMGFYRGEIFFVTRNGNTTGSEQEVGRPAVIVSNNIGNENSRIVQVVYLTSQPKAPLPTHVPVMCKVPSIALCEQITTVYQDRLSDYIRTCTDAEMEAIDRALMVSLGIDDKANDGNEVKSLKDECNVLIKKCSDLERENQTLELTINDFRNQPASASDMVKIETERDLYKNLYEQLFDRVIG